MFATIRSIIGFSNNENESANDRDDDVLLHDRRFVSHPESQLQPYYDGDVEQECEPTDICWPASEIIWLLFFS